MSKNAGPCKAPNCTRQAFATGECKKHYTSRRKWGAYEPDYRCQAPDCSHPAVMNRTGISSGRCARHGQPQEGDTRTDSDGYVRVFRDGRWRLEHRCVMERAVGRPLVDRETVHHINGDRADNRFENLELWFSPQPYGQRVDDLLRYAVEVHRDRIVEMLATQEIP